MEIRLATEADKTRWDDFALGHEQGLAYHRFGWLEAITSAYGFKVYPLLAEKDGGIVGLLPLAHIRWPLTRGELVSLPYCDLGGVLADSDTVAGALWARALALAKELSVPRVKIRSSVPLWQGAQSHPSKVRMVLDLPEGSVALLNGFKAKLRSQVKKPERDGFTATLGGTELLDSFYQVFAQNMRDLGSPVHSRRWFEELVAGYAGSARVGLVRMPDGKAAAAGIILAHGKTVTVPWASSLREFNRHNPNMLLYWTFLSYAADKGFDSFDFGRSSVGEGTYKFKKQWGAEESPVFWSEYPAKNEGGKIAGKSRNRDLAARCWMCLPLGMANFLGPHLRKNISL